MHWGPCDNDASATGFLPGKCLTSQEGRGVTAQPSWNPSSLTGTVQALSVAGTLSTYAVFFELHRKLQETFVFLALLAELPTRNLCWAGAMASLKLKIPGQQWTPGCWSPNWWKGDTGSDASWFTFLSVRLKVNKYFQFCELKKHRIKFMPVRRRAQCSKLLWMQKLAYGSNTQVWTSLELLYLLILCHFLGDHAEIVTKHMVAD